MNIQEWFENNGTYQEGLQLYASLPQRSNLFLKSIQRENTSNFLKLKYELKKALNNNSAVTTKQSEKIATELPTGPKIEPLLQVIINESASTSFEKETMAMYPMELHATYRNRISNFYEACELKFKLNMLHPDAEEEAFDLILQLEELWESIDRAWFILNHWKDHGRIMPVDNSEDFTKLNGIQLAKRRDRLQSSISKRTKTLDKLFTEVESSPEDRVKLNLYNRKKEQLQQLMIDLETIRNLLKNE
jgi:hypothetical protein